MTPAQCRAARALINMSEAKLSHAAVVTIAVVRDFELASLGPRCVIATIQLDCAPHARSAINTAAIV
jgi:hypothetical protein